MCQHLLDCCLSDSSPVGAVATTVNEDCQQTEVDDRPCNLLVTLNRHLESDVMEEVQPSTQIVRR